MARITIADAISQAWESRRVEVIAQVCDGLRYNHGFNYHEVHSLFCKVTGREIPLPEWDAIMFLADEGYSGPLEDIGRGWMQA
jgi:hypothetical protein